jgi:hypothetical protein
MQVPIATSIGRFNIPVSGEPIPSRYSLSTTSTSDVLSDRSTGYERLENLTAELDNLGVQLVSFMIVYKYNLSQRRSFMQAWDFPNQANIDLDLCQRAKNSIDQVLMNSNPEIIKSPELYNSHLSNLNTRFLVSHFLQQINPRLSVFSLTTLDKIISYADIYRV